MTGSLQEAREALGQRLRELRRAAGMSGRNLAELASWHESKVSKLEHGTRPPSESDLRTYCDILGTPEQLPDLLATVRNIDSAYVEWRRILSAGTRRGQHTLTKLAERTKLMRIYQPYVVPGLLQTAEYAEAILRQAIDFYGIPEDLDDGIAKRLQRQQILYHGSRRFHILMGAQALATGVAGNDVGVSAELKVTQPREIALYGKAFDILARQSMTGDAARILLRTEIDRRRR
ncbi:Scr1 family TA system antitoxin-like transcriptional regulator [Nocardia sp. NPDC051756]|uniref:Scr1 family TA system antitoxin-like transcriptional regulator n=1 Tax=Nocardia sp. NPDC051756 TaxID=3154751 RepID=UPI003437E32B